MAKRNITRYYKCEPNEPNVFTCQFKDTALVGKSDDAVYRSSDPNVKKQIKNLSGGNDDTSLNGERRRVFCLLRDRKREEALKPTTRLTRAKCPE